MIDVPKSQGRILELHRNYGTISSDSFKHGDEIMPFEITEDMLVEHDGVECISYTSEVEFDLIRDDNVRHRQIKKATNIKFVGNEKLLKPRTTSLKYLDMVQETFDEYCFKNPYPNDEANFERYLHEIGFRPRMLEYLLCNGIFLKRSLYNIYLHNSPSTVIDNFVFDPRLVVVVDKIDQRLRSFILKWTLGIEISYKSFISTALLESNSPIANEVVEYWRSKDSKGRKQNERARAKRKFRECSEIYDYVRNPDLAPFDDLMEQLDLSELERLLKKLKELCHGPSVKFSSFDALYDSTGMIQSVAVLRNAAAHGRMLLPGFCDPDFNGNWDLVFDDADTRSRVTDWALYEPLKQVWHSRGVSEDVDSLLTTVFDNPYRRAWMELHYVYRAIISQVDPEQYKQFHLEACRFLRYEPEDPTAGLNAVDISDLRLADMGPTTLEQLSGVPAPHKEIANEVADVWTAFPVGEH